jgi:uncharacterized membrane protein YidH (DUF202 family)
VDVDRGLQTERTVLAWSRTAFASVVAAVLIVREAVVERENLALIVLSTLAGGVLLAVVAWRVTSLRRAVGHPAAAPRRAAALFVAATVALQTLACVLVLV